MFQQQKQHEFEKKVYGGLKESDTYKSKTFITETEHLTDHKNHLALTIKNDASEKEFLKKITSNNVATSRGDKKYPEIITDKRLISRSQ